MLALVFLTAIFIAGVFHKTEKSMILVFAIWQMISLLALEYFELIDFYFISAIGNYCIALSISQGLVYLNFFTLLCSNYDISSTYYIVISNCIFSIMLFISLIGERFLNVSRIFNRALTKNNKFYRDDNNGALQSKSYKSAPRT
jgi:hypothetical protein